MTERSEKTSNAETEAAINEGLSLDAMTEEQKKTYVSGLIRFVDRMNTELMQNEPVKLFLWKLNYAVMRTGQPIPRSVCTQIRGIDKALLKKLVKNGFLQEYHVRSRHNGAIYVAYTLPEDVTFDADKNIIRVLPADDIEETTEEEQVNVDGHSNSSSES